MLSVTRIISSSLATIQAVNMEGDMAFTFNAARLRRLVSQTTNSLFPNTAWVLLLSVGNIDAIGPQQSDPLKGLQNQ